MRMIPQSILVTGATGQVGTELIASLRKIHGPEQVLATDIHPPDSGTNGGPVEVLNVLGETGMRRVFESYRPTQAFHLAALLSAVGDEHPQTAWQLNMEGILHVLRLSVECQVEKVFWPGSIAVYGPLSPEKNTPHECTINPHSVYGIRKLAGEGWGEYHARHRGLDVRSLR